MCEYLVFTSYYDTKIFFINSFPSSSLQKRVNKAVTTQLNKTLTNVVNVLKAEDDGTTTERKSIRVETKNGNVGLYVSKKKEVKNQEKTEAEEIKLKTTKIIIPPITKGKDSNRSAITKVYVMKKLVCLCLCVC